MSRLFTKILLWFILTVLVSSSASFYIWNTFLRDRQPNFGGRSFELREARTAYETRGQAGLQAFLDHYKEVTNASEAYLTDGSGRDLLTGKDMSGDISTDFRGRGGPMFPFVRIENGRRNYFVGSSRSRDGKYAFIAMYPARDSSNTGWSVEVPIQTWWMLVIFAGLCYVLARHLTSPLSNMQKTLDRFGQGDFSARVQSRRSDELGQLARAIDRMAERIDLLLKAQKRLLQDISHELRSPLARLGVAVELGRGGGDPHSAFDRIEREADRLNTLVGELIQVTRAEGDPNGLATEPVRLDDLVRLILDDVHIEADKRHIVLNPRIGDAELTGNPELLRRAVENIVRNAIRHSPEGSSVDVTLETAEGVHRVIVRDYGSGVPDDSLSRIFDPFYRVEKDRGRTSGGVGLGLAIAKRAVELHHGVMRAANVQPGLRVEIDLPLATSSVS